jgi:hypothetical protein
MSPAKKVQALEHAKKKAAKARKRVAKKKAAAPRVRGPDDDYSVREWCFKRGISKVHFYQLLKLGCGPRTMKVGKRRTISPQADAEWQRDREAESKTIEAAA